MLSNLRNQHTTGKVFSSNVFTMSLEDVWLPQQEIMSREFSLPYSECCWFLHHAQVMVRLQLVEKIGEKFRVAKGSDTFTQTLGQLSECCLHRRTVHINLAIPVSATPGFSTDIGETEATEAQVEMARMASPTRNSHNKELNKLKGCNTLCGYRKKAI